ncbi:MAG TPA: hypothetical protein VL551_28175 [Actinospica sp.]|jgi:hypothetical protein|nr:hypothetical protein [Actinospica sp.]
MSPTVLHAFDRHPMIVGPTEVRPGDWLRDLGTLRRVEAVETSGSGVSIRFAGGVDGQFATLSVPGDVPVTVWRPLSEEGCTGRAEA